MADPKLKLGNDIWATKQKSLLAYNDEGGNFKSLPFQVDRISGGTYVGRNGLIQYASSNEPRIDFLNNTKGHLLLEPQRTNQILYSEDFTNAVWQKLGGGSGVAPVVTANYSTAPNGSNTADRVVLDMGSATSGDNYSIIRNFGTSGSTGTNSIYIKSNTSDSYTIGIDNVGTVETITVTPQWQRFSYSVTNSDRLQISLRGAGGSTSRYADVSMWGGSLENGNFLTTYIPTTSAAVTRIADSCINAGTSSTFNDSEGVLFVESSAFETTVGINAHLSISDGSFSNLLYIYYATDGNISFAVFVGGVLVCNIGTSKNHNEFHKIAAKYKENDFALWIDGVEVASDTFGSTYANGTLDILSFTSAYNNPFFAKIKQVMYFNEALSDSELQALTTL
jgi:hypothetical protein